MSAEKIKISLYHLKEQVLKNVNNENYQLKLHADIENSQGSEEIKCLTIKFRKKSRLVS